MNYSHDNWSAIRAHIGKPEELDTSACNAGPPFPARLIAVSLPPEKALISKTRLLSENRLKGRVVQAETLEAAGHVLLLTSLPEDEYSAEQVADCYRLQWQIELAFKWLKSLLHLDALRAKEPELAKAWIFANLLAAFLIDDIIQPSLDFPPEVPDPKRRTNSLWRITKMVIWSLRVVIRGTVSKTQLKNAGHRLNEAARSSDGSIFKLALMGYPLLIIRSVKNEPQLKIT